MPSVGTFRLIVATRRFLPCAIGDFLSSGSMAPKKLTMKLYTQGNSPLRHDAFSHGPPRHDADNTKVRVQS